MTALRSRPVPLSAALIIGTIAAGLALRLVRLGLPSAVTKYGGSILWALVIYWIISFMRPRWSLIRCALASAAVASGVELFKLYHVPALDAWRLTLPGRLILGRVFSVSDLIAYAVAILVGVLLDRAIRSSTGGASP